MKRSQVYFNLHKRLFSVQQSGKVYAHADGVLLENVRFNVSKAGQRKVRETGRKNVHARVSGYDPSTSSESFQGGVLNPDLVQWCRESMESLRDRGWRTAKYNPYENATFICWETGEPVHEARKALMFMMDGFPVILYKMFDTLGSKDLYSNFSG